MAARCLDVIESQVDFFGGAMCIKLLIADGDPSFREYLGRRFAAELGLRICAMTGDGYETLDLATTESYDIAILENALTGINGASVARRLSDRCTKTSLLFLSFQIDPITVMEAIRNGATGNVSKSDDFRLILEAVHAVTTGSVFISRAVASLFIDFISASTEGKRSQAYVLLSEREREVLQLVAQGLRTKDIARKLFISTRTVSAHRSNIMRKLGVGSVAEMTTYAIREGLRPLPAASGLDGV